VSAYPGCPGKEVVCIYNTVVCMMGKWASVITDVHFWGTQLSME